MHPSVLFLTVVCASRALRQRKKTQMEQQDVQDAFAILPWEAESETEIANIALRCFNRQNDMQHRLGSQFAIQSAVSFILLSNKMEATLPDGLSEMITYKELQHTFESPIDKGALFDAKHTWSADGHSTKEVEHRAQLHQHMLAYRFMKDRIEEGNPFSVDLLCETHRILMNGAVDKNKVRVENGTIRTIPLHSSSGFNFLPAEQVLPRLKHIIHTFESESAKSSPTQIVFKIARLLYDLLVCHPFQDGNGRLCRIVVACALHGHGIPFAVPLTSHHKKARRHYCKCIANADKRHGTDVRSLASFITFAIHARLANFENWIRCDDQDE